MPSNRKLLVASLMLCMTFSILAVLSFQAGSNDHAAVACNAALGMALLSTTLVKLRAIRLFDVITYRNFMRAEDFFLSVAMAPALFVLVDMFNAYEDQEENVQILSVTGMAIFAVTGLMFGLKKVKI